MCRDGFVGVEVEDVREGLRLGEEGLEFNVGFEDGRGDEDGGVSEDLLGAGGDGGEDGLRGDGGGGGAGVDAVEEGGCRRWCGGWGYIVPSPLPTKRVVFLLVGDLLGNALQVLENVEDPLFRGQSLVAVFKDGGIKTLDSIVDGGQVCCRDGRSFWCVFRGQTADLS